MSIPHDFYKYDPDHPELHNRGEGRHYLEPDWHATHMDAQLPALSAIGRGPRGEGLFVGATVNQDGEISFTLNSTLTGEVVWESPNLAPPEIDFNAVDYTDLVPGVATPLGITVKRGGVTKTTNAWLPAGQVGSLIYLLSDDVDRRDDHTYTTTVADLTLYGKTQYHNRPTPRPNDIVMFQYLNGDERGLGIGTIENVGGTTRNNYSGGEIPTPTNVVFTGNIYIPVGNMIGSNMYYGEVVSVSTSDNVATFNVEADGFTSASLKKGTVLSIFFEHSGDAFDAKLNVNGTGAKNIISYGGMPMWDDGTLISFVYRNGNWYISSAFGG